jgi:hypothetical protein
MKSSNRKVIPCAEVAKHICENLDEKINSPLCRAIKRHLQACPDCNANLISLKNTIGLYRRYRTPQPTSDCHKNLMAKLASMR